MAARHRRVAPVAFVAAVVVIYPFVMKEPFWQNIGVLALIFATAAMGWTLLGGYMGQVSIGHAIFFGIGAYSVAVFDAVLSLSPWLGVLAGLGIAVATGVLLGFPVFRLGGNYFAIATLAAQQVVYIAVVNTDFLGLIVGIAIPVRSPSFVALRFSFQDLIGYHLLAAATFGVATLVVWLYLRGKTGLFARAIRDDQVVARAMGVPIRRHKLYAMAVSAAITASAGAVYALYILYVDPRFVLQIPMSATIFLAAVLGGTTSLWGPLLGAIILVFVREWTRISFSGSGDAADFLIYGLLIMAVAIFEPRGLVGIASKTKRFLRRAVRRNRAPTRSAAGESG